MTKSKKLPLALSPVNDKSLKTLLENRTVYHLDHCELNLFETFVQAHQVPLKFNDLTINSMLNGKKIVCPANTPCFEYQAGESLIIPANLELKIDFPEATMDNPVRCLALAIDDQKITETLDFLNEKYPRNDSGAYWTLDKKNFFFYDNDDLTKSINKLIEICQSGCPNKDIFAELTLKELLVRMIQIQTLTGTSNDKSKDSNALLSQSTDYVRRNIGKSISIKDLASGVCMSPSTLFRVFKREIGISPGEFIIMEKIRLAKQLLKNQAIFIKQVAFECGFEDSNYFIRTFKHYEGITPGQYQLLHKTE